MVPYASVVGSLMNGKDRTYLDIVRISGLFLAMSNPAIDHCNGIKCISLMLS
jgi:hypothetical protein